MLLRIGLAWEFAAPGPFRFLVIANVAIVVNIVRSCLIAVTHPAIGFLCNETFQISLTHEVNRAGETYCFYEIFSDRVSSSR